MSSLYEEQLPAKSREVEMLGKHTQNPGAKYDTGKLPVHSILMYWPRALEELAKVIAHGESLHGWNTWDTIDNPERRYAEAQMRHELVICKGETIDESGCHHLAHEAFNVLARLELSLRKGEMKCL